MSMHTVSPMGLNPRQLSHKQPMQINAKFHNIYEEKQKDPNNYQETLINVFKNKLGPLYGNQDNAIASILKRDDRVGEILVNEDDKSQHFGIIVYKRMLQNEFKHLGIEDSVELKTLIVVDSEKNSGKGYGTLLLNRVKKIAADKLASGIHVTVSENAQGSLPFFLKQGFKVIKTWEEKYKSGVKEHLLFLKLISSSQPQASHSVQNPVTKPAPQRNFNILNPPNPSRIQKPLDVQPQKRRHPDDTNSSDSTIGVVPQKKGPKEPYLHQATLKKIYIHQIREGRKTVEGRINKGQFYAGKYRKGDHIRFYYQANPEDDVVCEVTAVKVYKSFGEMLKSCGVQKCVPDARSLEHGIQMYHAIPGYEDNSKEHGVVAICLNKIK